MPATTWTVSSGGDLGRAVSEIRHRRGLTQAQLSSDAGMARPWLSKLETGRSTPVLDQQLRLLRRLGAKVTITFGDDDAEA